MVFVAVVLGLLGLLVIAGFVVVTVKVGALADELRDARRKDAAQLRVKQSEMDGKLQGVHLDLGAHRKSIDGLAQQLDLVDGGHRLGRWWRSSGPMVGIDLVDGGGRADRWWVST